MTLDFTLNSPQSHDVYSIFQRDLKNVSLLPATHSIICHTSCNSIYKNHPLVALSSMLRWRIGSAQGVKIRWKVFHHYILPHMMLIDGDGDGLSFRDSPMRHSCGLSIKTYLRFFSFSLLVDGDGGRSPSEYLLSLYYRVRNAARWA